MKTRFIFCLSLLVGSALLVGCNQMPGGASGGQGVVIMDLAAIANATGQDEVIRQESDAARAELGAQLQALAASLEQQISAEREKIGITPTAQDSQRLQELTMQARQQINNAQMQAQNQASQVEVELVAAFRDRVAPLAERIAKEKGASAVLAADAYLFWFDPAIDITDEVIAAWRALPADASAQVVAEEAAEELAEVQAELDEVEEELAVAEEELQEVAEDVAAGEVPAAEPAE